MKNYFDNIDNIVCARDFLNPVIEPFDGIRKNHARKIFGILLILIILNLTINSLD